MAPNAKDVNTDGENEMGHQIISIKHNEEILGKLCKRGGKFLSTLFLSLKTVCAQQRQ